MRLTQKTIASLKLPVGKSEAIIFDDDLPGFGLRLRAGGSRTFVFQYKLGTKQRRMALGKATALTPDKARDIAANHHAAVRLGRDPAGEKADAKARTAETFEAAARAFLERQERRLRPRSLIEVQRHLLVNAKPLHAMQLGTVDRRAIATLLAQLDSARGPVSANRTRSTLSAFYSWAIREGIAESNPVTGTNKRDEQARDRVLSPDELRTIWNALAPEPDHHTAIVKLLMLTGQRRDEIAGLRWSEIDFETATITLPRERVKNNRQHIVPLSTPALAILRAQPYRAEREFVFGFGNGPFSGWSDCKEQVDARAALRPWVLHDLRRSVATHMAEIGIQPHIIEAVLNHISGHKAGVAGIYNRSTYDREKRDALNLWAEHLLAIVGGRKPSVVPLRRA
jgi:integrase